MGGSAGGGNFSEGGPSIAQLMNKYRKGGELTGDQRKQIFQSSLDDWAKQSMGGGFNGVPAFFIDGPRGSGGGGGGGGGGPTGPTGAGGPGGPSSPNMFQWQFPQYTQTWAFTPPTPSPYYYPPPFDTSIYGNPLKKKNVKKNT